MHTTETLQDNTDELIEIVVPITKPLHFTYHPDDVEVTEPDVDIHDVVILDNRPEATLVTLVSTNRGRIEALIRVPRETFDDADLVSRKKAVFGPGNSLIYTKSQPAISA